MNFLFACLLGGILADQARETLRQLLSDSAPAIDGSSSLLELLPLLLLPGILPSHKDRRRKKDHMAPCENSDPLDTTDNDCFTARWNLMVGYYPAHMGLMKGERKMVTAEFELEKLWSSIVTESANSWIKVNGTGGSKEEGLTGESQLLKTATQKLQRSSIASVNIIQSAEADFTTTAINDVRLMKLGLAAALAALKTQSDIASKMHENSQKKNTDRMNKRASTALRDSADTLLDEQRALGSQVTSAQTSSLEKQSVFNSESAALREKEESVRNAVEVTETKVTRDLTSFESNSADSISKSTDEVGGNSVGATNRLGTQLGVIISNLSKKSTDQILAGSSQLQTESDQKLKSAKALSDRADMDMRDTLMSNFTGSITDSVQHVSGEIDQVESAIEAGTVDATRASADVSAANAGLTSETEADVNAVSAETQLMSSDAQADFGAAKKKVADFVNSAGATGNSGFRALLKALSEAQTSSASTLTLSESDYTELISKVMADMGSDGAGASKDLFRIADAIASGQFKNGQEIQAQWKRMSDESKSSGSTWMDTLDGLGSSVVAHETESEKSYSSSNRDLIDSFTSGKGGVESSVAQFLRDQGAAEAGVRSQLLSEKNDGLAKASEFQQSAKLMDQLLGGVGKSSSAVGEVLSSMDAAAADSTQEYARALAGSDMALATGISGEYRNWVASANSTGQNEAKRAFDRLMRERSRELSSRESLNNDKARVLQSEEKKTLSQSSSASGALASIQSQFTAVADESKLGSADADFTNKLVELELSDANFAALREADVSRISSDGLARIRAVVAENLARRTSDATSAAAHADRVLGEIGADANEQRDQETKLDVLLGALLNAGGLKAEQRKLGSDAVDVLANSVDVFADQSSSLQSSFNNTKSTQSAILAKLIQTVQSTILEIPLSLTSGALALERNFRIASSDLSTRILAMKEQLATADSAEAREAAMRGLVVLTKLQAVQEGALLADTLIRGNLSAQSEASIASAANVQYAMANILGAMVAVTNHVENDSNSARSVGQASATLTNDLSLILNSTSDRLSNDAAQSALVGAFRFAAARAQTDYASNLTNFEFVRGVNKMDDDVNRTFENLGNISNWMHSLDTTTQTSSGALGELVERVLHDVSTGASLIVGNSTDSQEDVLTKLALVRMSMASFLTLWTEYAQSLDRKFVSVRSGDEEFLKTVESNIKSELQAGERAIDEQSRSSGAANSAMLASNSAAGEWETRFTDSVSVLRNQLNAINAKRTSEVVDLSDKIGEAVNFNLKVQRDQTAKIDAIIADFNAHQA